MTHSRLISGPVLCLCLRLDGGRPFVFPSSAPPPRRQWSARYLVDGFRKPRLRPFSFGGKSLSRMDEGEISDNGNIYKSFCAFIIPPFISNLWKPLISWTAFHSCVVRQHRLWSQCVQAHVVSVCVEINSPLVGWEWMTRFVLRPGRLGRDFPSTPILTEWRPLSLPSNRRPRG